jgi:hypothetical protein
MLAKARHKGKREVEEIVASLRPLPAVPSTIRKLPARQVLLDTNSGAPTPMTAAPSPPVATPAIKMAPRPMETSLAPERYKLQFTISRETHAKLRRVQALGRHVIPSGDPAAIFDRALTLLLHDLERRRCAAVTSPRAARETEGGSRHIPASVKREVWRRDDGRCAYTGRGAARSAASWSITMCSPSLPVARPRWPTSNCGAGPTTHTRRLCFLGSGASTWWKSQPLDWRLPKRRRLLFRNRWLAQSSATCPAAWVPDAHSPLSATLGSTAEGRSGPRA